MTTLRPIIYCILSTIFSLSCSGVISRVPQRQIRVRALADVALRARNPGWPNELRGLVEAASDYYEREFGIRLITESTQAWPMSERVESTPDLLAMMKKDYPTRSADDGLVIAFTAESVSRYLRDGRPRVDRIGNCSQGLGRYIVVPVRKVFKYAGAFAEPEIDVLALIHEIAHIFGAEHVNDTASIMNEDFGYRTEFDGKNRAVIENNKFCPFAKYAAKR
jgi:rhamnose utilization protein RhaD (predicted bifunctional aldolase and dehydrogenase)